MSLYTYNAIIEKVTDGDSLVLFIDMGRSIFIREKVRLFGINCPELSTQAGKDAFTWLVKALVEKYQETGSRNVTVRTIKDKSDKYGRLLGVISVGDWVLNDELVKASHAVSYDGGART